MILAFRASNLPSDRRIDRETFSKPQEGDPFPTDQRQSVSAPCVPPKYEIRGIYSLSCSKVCMPRLGLHKS